MSGGSSSGNCELSLDDDGAGTNKEQLLYAAINAGGGNNAPNGAASALDSGLFIPAGKALRCVVGGGAPAVQCSVHYTLET